MISRMYDIIITNCETENRNNNNIEDLKSLKVLDFSDNVWLDYDSEEVGPDPLDILSGTCFETPELQSLILKCPGPPDCDYYVEPLKPSFNCGNLTKIELINLNIEYLELYYFPNSLEEMVVRDLKLRGISYSIYDFRNFSNLNNL
ncbi:uncharacterized protein KGF55_003422 [Candida pseudojiufengensis]|uniref:uncharacterized protein n=1 Tax=Candida pseudojiufengensis TaxID=497109 RepID=UPI002224D35D|nr:uncharacterized protein KGF55_003422 [Candida pseudojiufengensis]KAI5962346.1 hypothetical protein KGF55_003422 [Candida pseudojiufengensis]